jgi:ATP-dependent exoDNAse (exonuclease V) beta subunit
MKIERIDTPAGRFYKTPAGQLYPSVTTVLASIPNPALDEWRKAIGDEQAKKITERAANNGTRMHQFCEDYLSGKNPKLDMFDKDSYAGLTDVLDQVKPVALEKMLYSDKLRVAGTLDCLGKYQGQWHIIDWKTTSRLKHDGEFDSYWLQTSAYAAMIYEHLNLVVPNLMIVMQDLGASETRIFHAKTVDWLPKFKEIRDSLPF